MDTVPRDVIECVILDGQMPQYGDGAEWCEQHDSCYRCAKDIHDMMGEEIRRLKAERDRALAELDKALGEREEERGCIHYDPKRHYCNVHDCDTDDYKRGFDEGFASADDWLAQHEDAMAEHGWIRLPKDAHGEYIHVGDVMEGVDKYDSLKKVMGKVITVSFEADGLVDVAVQAWNGDVWRRAYLDPDASVYRHHHEPTVEDVLEELLREYDRDDSELTNGEIIERFAAKLQLVGEDE